MSEGLSLLDDFVEFGTPFHGLWRGGHITLPNAETHAMGDPGGPGVILLKVPGIGEVTRSPAQLAADAAAGKEYRNYALLSGHSYGGVQVPPSGLGPAYHILIDDANAVWLMRMSHVGSGRFSISVRRFGLFDGATHDWSGAVEYQCPGTFWGSVGSAVRAIGQAPSGRDWVIGNGVGSVPDLLVRFTCSGAVDTSLPGLGVTFIGTPLEWPNRPNHHYEHHYAVEGTLVVTDVNVFHSSSSGLDYTQTVIVTDGVTTSDNGAPGSGYAILTSSRTYECDKIVTDTQERVADKIIWASYLPDGQLVQYKVTGRWSQDLSYTDFNIYNATNNTTALSGSGSTDNRLISTGATTIYDQLSSGTPVAIETDMTTNSYFLPRMVDGYVVDESLDYSPLDLAGVVEVGQQALSNGDRHGIYLTAIGQSGDFFGQPLVALVDRYQSVSGGTTTTTTISVHAPTGSSLMTEIPLANLSATWQPITDAIVVDTVRVCWM